MDIEEIVEEWLKVNDYDGLYNSEVDCACHLEDLMPCSEPHTSDCLAGVIKKYIRETETGSDFIIGPKETGKK